MKGSHNMPLSQLTSPPSSTPHGRQVASHTHRSTHATLRVSLLMLAAGLALPLAMFACGDDDDDDSDSGDTSSFGTGCDEDSDCIEGSTCEEGECVEATDDDDAVADDDDDDDDFFECAPSCNGRACGDDGCGGNCGACTGKDEYCSFGKCVVRSKNCVTGCTTSADCAAPGPGPFSSDNWECQNGVCQYQGCNSTEECNEENPGGTQVCSGEGTKFCRLGCDNRDQCSSGDFGAYRRKNYTCDSGFCEWQGCQSDEQCNFDVAGNKLQQEFVCRRFTQSGECFLKCETTADCGDPEGPNKFTNYDCVDSACVYRGCQSDDECNTLPDGSKPTSNRKCI